MDDLIYLLITGMIVKLYRSKTAHQARKLKIDFFDIKKFFAVTQNQLI